MGIPERLAAIEKDLVATTAMVSSIQAKIDETEKNIGHIVDCLEAINRCLSIISKI